jgi:hypothetical protein
MSRRGGGGGRGRGGSKSSNSNATKELLKRSASEAGLDDRHVKVLSDITRPPLFPDFLWKSSGNYWNEEEEIDSSNNNINGLGLQPQQQQSMKSEAPSPAAVTPRKLPAAMASTNDKQREMNRRFQNAPFYIRPGVHVDIVRYSDRVERNKGKATTPDVAVLASIAIASSNGHGMKNTAAIAAAYKSYFPEELLVGEKRNTRRPKERKAGGRSKTQTPDTTTAHAVAMKLEKLDHQEEERDKVRTTSITSITSNDDELLLLPVPPLTTSKNTRQTGEAEEAVLSDDDNVDDDDDDDDHRHDALEDNVEEELGEDYTTNYYASDDDNNNNDDDDGEPTF